MRAHEYFLQLIFDLQLQSSCMKSNLIDIILNIKYFNQNANDFSCAVFLIFSMSDDPTWFDSFDWSNDSFSSQSRSMYGTFDACSAYRNEIWLFEYFVTLLNQHSSSTISSWQSKLHMWHNNFYCFNHIFGMKYQNIIQTCDLCHLRHMLTW